MLQVMLFVYGNENYTSISIHVLHIRFRKIQAITMKKYKDYAVTSNLKNPSQLKQGGDDED